MSGRQRRVQIKQRRAEKKAAPIAAAARAQALRAAKARAEVLRGKVLVNPYNLRPTNSYGTPCERERKAVARMLEAEGRAKVKGRKTT
jgi:hypothetical protein